MVDSCCHCYSKTRQHGGMALTLIRHLVSPSVSGQWRQIFTPFIFLYVRCATPTPSPKPEHPYSLNKPGVMLSSFLPTGFGIYMLDKPGQTSQLILAWFAEMLQNMGHVFSPSGKTTSGVRLEIDDDVGQLEVAFLFKVGKHSGAEKDFTLSYSVQVRVQLQSLDLQHKDQSRITITDFIQNEDKISVRSCIFFFFFLSFHIFSWSDFSWKKGLPRSLWSKHFSPKEVRKPTPDFWGSMSWKQWLQGTGWNSLSNTHHFVTGFLAIHETSWNDVGGEKLVALTEFLEDDPVGEALPTDPDALQHTVAPQLVQHQWRVDFARLKRRAQIQILPRPWKCTSLTCFFNRSVFTHLQP